jgi:hypothetical protein
MRTGKAARVPAGLEATRRRFERWRASRPAGRRIPASLWAAAVRLARELGVSRTANALRLDYYSLQQRLADEPSDRPAAQTGPGTTFLELPAALGCGPCECVFEREDAAGTKIRLQLKGLPTPDLIALSRSFWES